MNRVGQVWAHKSDIMRIYLLVALWGDGSNPQAYLGLKLTDGTTRRITIGPRTKLRFKRLA